jgi:hypothetical protein
MVAELERVTDCPKKQELRRLMLDALQEDRERASARMFQERDRRRAAEAVKSARLREMRLAREAAQAEAHEAPAATRGFAAKPAARRSKASRRAS